MPESKRFNGESDKEILPSSPDEFDQNLYDDFYRIATRLMAAESAGHTLQATALVNEAWLRMNSRSKAQARDRQHLVAVAARQMRHALIDHARKKKAAKRPTHNLRVSLSQNEDLLSTHGDNSLDLLDLCVALDELEELNCRHSKVFEMRFFGGQTVAECAEYLNVAERTIKYDWKFATAWIAKRLNLNTLNQR